jgi:hypothetical protein
MSMLLEPEGVKTRRIGVDLTTFWLEIDVKVMSDECGVRRVGYSVCGGQSSVDISRVVGLQSIWCGGRWRPC